MITVFTPTYNRAYSLPRLYESLQKQTFKDFEWLIVDDGSTDNTVDMVTGWSKEGKLTIRYIQMTNGGKHRAINKGVALAKGKLFFIVDSDDWLPYIGFITIMKKSKMMSSLLVWPHQEHTPMGKK